jgi:hypothetical protein
MAWAVVSERRRRASSRISSTSRPVTSASLKYSASSMRVSCCWRAVTAVTVPPTSSLGSARVKMAFG